MNDTPDLNHQSLKGWCNDFLNYIFIGLQWPASYFYQTKAGCCLPTTGKPAIDFFITGLQTYNSTTGKAVTKCTKSNFNTEVILLSISLKWHIKFLSGFSFSWSNLHLWSVYLIVWSEIWSIFFCFFFPGLCGVEMKLFTSFRIWWMSWMLTGATSNAQAAMGATIGRVHGRHTECVRVWTNMITSRQLLSSGQSSICSLYLQAMVRSSS